MSTYLIVDDSPTIRLTMDRILRTVDTESPTILEASSAKKAIQLFDENDIDIVFLDMHLGDAHGNDVLRDILRRRPEQKVVIVSMLPRHDPLVGDAIGQGALGYIEKPLRREQLATLLSEIEREYRPTRRIR